MPIKRLSRVVPVRVSREDQIVLRRWARERKADVSKIVREMIDERRRRELENEGEDAGGDVSVGVGVAA